MSVAPEIKRNVEVCDGNKAVAHAVLLSRPDVVAVYPITPQSAVGEWLSRWHDEGRLDAEVVRVEGENSSMGVCCSASLTGGRVFTATSSWGLLFMTDGLHYAAAYRIPVVMTNANRETPGIFTIGNSSQDMWSMRDTGWVQINVEDNQEILDSVIMAYRIAEDPEILLPVMVCYDGFYLSYRKDPLEIPEQGLVDRFLAPLEKSKRMVVSPDNPMIFGVPSFFPEDEGEGCTEFRYKHSAALERVKGKIDEVDREFEALFGRGYGGQIEEYRTEDAEIVLVATGSCVGTAKVVVDQVRDEGVKAGVIKVKLLRPFPRERLAQALKGRKAVGVIDRSVCFGYHCGHLYMEVKASIAFGSLPTDIPTLNFIGGLANLDISTEDIKRTIELTKAASRGESFKEVTWLSLE
ncbi:MAG: pyruvate synthase subunit PorA [Deltaproteobacteria bacterium]|nr:pyruvate synthase subunit PorA [Deltaproteobacteria bacterium]